ncbi:MAG: PA14 domain-containing protein [Chitinophagaceae bacterium]
MKQIFTLLFTLLITYIVSGQCTPAGNQTSYGTSDTWIGYVYDNMDFTNYSGYVTEGTPGNPNFDESFGGDNVNYATNGCPVYTETFSVRYKLTKTFAPGNYQFTVGADDGYRLSLDGGATWVINNYYDQSYNYSAYSTTLSGTYNLVLEYYENGGGNRVSFAMTMACAAFGDQTIYGTNNVWNGYIYKGMNFDTYSGKVTEGSASNPNFDENFGGSNTLYPTSDCSVTTETFSARYRLQKNFANGTYTITVGADDGYRLSLDGGSTWVINHWVDQGYNVNTYNATLTGNYNMVLEYYENGGDNRVTFDLVTNTLLPVQLLRFNGKALNNTVQLSWEVEQEINSDYYQVERSLNGIDFSAIGKITAIGSKTYGFTDISPADGTNYYRLRMVDKDGKSTLSTVIKMVSSLQKDITIYPTIVSNSTVYLKTNNALKNASLEVYEIGGRKLQQVQLPSNLAAGQTIQVALPVATVGNYVIICKSAGEIKAKQIVLVK